MPVIDLVVSLERLSFKIVMMNFIPSHHFGKVMKKCLIAQYAKAVEVLCRKTVSDSFRNRLFTDKSQKTLQKHGFIIDQITSFEST